MSVTIAQSVAVYLHVYNCLVIIIEYRSALHAMTLMGVTLIGGVYLDNREVQHSPNQPREDTGQKSPFKVPSNVSLAKCKT